MEFLVPRGPPRNSNSETLSLLDPSLCGSIVWRDRAPPRPLPVRPPLPVRRVGGGRLARLALAELQPRACGVAGRAGSATLARDTSTQAHKHTTKTHAITHTCMSHTHTHTHTLTWHHRARKVKQATACKAGWGGRGPDVSRIRSETRQLHRLLRLLDLRRDHTLQVCERTTTTLLTITSTAGQIGFRSTPHQVLKSSFC